MVYWDYGQFLWIDFYKLTVWLLTFIDRMSKFRNISKMWVQYQDICNMSDVEGNDMRLLDKGYLRLVKQR